jgi:hypothetical protein
VIFHYRADRVDGAAQIVREQAQLLRGLKGGPSLGFDDPALLSINTA